MQKKYRFRKIYFICNNKLVIEDCYEVTNAFRRKEYAEKLLESRGKKEHYYLWEDRSVPLPVKTVEEFYLVPAALYEKILKDHDLNAD